MRLIDADGVLDGIKINKLLARESAAERCMKIIKNATTYTEPPQKCLIGAWIPVADRLPEKDTDYLVTMVVPGYFNGQPHTNWLCWYSDDHEWTDTDGDTIPEQETVVAWMSLPEPYRSAT